MDNAQNNPAEQSLLKQAFLAMQELQAKLDRAERRNSEPIAIVGMGCRFPGGAVDPESFWTLLREGRNAISRVPAERWDVDAYYDPDPDAPGKMVTRYGGFLDRAADGFDAGFFEIAPREAASMDPQQRLALEVAWETLENAGVSPAGLQGSKTGVFLGIASSDYNLLGQGAGNPALMDAHYASGVAHSIAAGRISYLLGLEGPSISLDTACSSSLVATHLACQSLRAGDCSLALAGGVNLMLAPQTTAMLSRVRMLAPDGRCKAFDAAADGFVRGEGCGFVALKTLSQAQADGDRILAVIRGTAVNQDGASSSLTAPNGPSQISLMRQALAGAGIVPGEVSYIEAHGTGTALGDPIELQALGAVYGLERPPDKPLMVASLKTNVGHLEAAAGVAGLIKAVLALQHCQIPPHLNLTQPTPHVRWDQLRLAVPLQLTDWTPDAGPRIAAASSFGFSGTNAHVVVAEAPVQATPRRETGWPLQILTASAKSSTALRRLIGEYRNMLETDADLRDVCFTANTGRSHFSHRACFLGPGAEDIRRQMGAFENSGLPHEAGRVGFLFTGQGSQYAGMGGELFESAPVFRAAMESCAEAWRRETGEDLIALLYPAEGAANPLEQAKYAQPALFALEYGLATLWQSWGIEPAVVLGHSLGEYVAAVIAGVFSMEDGLRLVCARARLMDTLTRPGAMRSISASPERVRAALAGWEEEVSIAAINAPESVVISGSAEAVGQVAAKLESEGIRTRALAVTHGFHSPLLEPILDGFEACAGEVKYSAPRIRIISNRTGEAAKAEEMTRPGYWREHMRNTVLFEAGLRAALATGCKTWLELGPQPHLLSLAKSSHPSGDVSWLPSMRKGRSPWLDLLGAMQTLYLSGAEIDWKALHSRSGQPIALPTYPFERHRHWFPEMTKSNHTLPPPQSHPLLGTRLVSPLAEIQFQSVLGPGQPAHLEEHAIGGHCVVPAAAYIEMALSAAAAVTGRPADVHSAAFLRSCVFDEPQVLQCVLQGDAAGHSFAIYSRPQASGQADWVLNATGETAPRTLEESLRADLDVIRRRCSSESDARSFYRRFEEGNVYFGPNFRPLTHIWRGDGEALVEFAVSSEVAADLDRYAIHPVALDACFQAVVALLPTEGGTKYLPVALESLHLAGDPRGLALAHARVAADSGGGSNASHTAEVRGYDRQGNLLLKATGMVMRPLLESIDAQGGAAASPFSQVEWGPIEPQANPEWKIDGVCALYGELDSAGGLAQALEKRGIRSVLAAADMEWASVGEFIYIAPPVVEDTASLSAERVMELQSASLGECLRIVQSLLQREEGKPPRLWIVTRGAQGPGLSTVLQAPLWGFARSVVAERPEIRVMRIDLDPASKISAEDLLTCMKSAGNEDELALRNGILFAPRLRPIASVAAYPAAPADSENSRLELARPGTIEGLETVAVSRRNPGPGEVEIRIRAAGLNFRDVLSVLGMYPGKIGPLGGECAGVVERVGPGGGGLQPGDEVLAIGPGCFARYITTRADMVWPKPAGLSFEAAVTIPIAFLTAWHGLKTLAALQPNEHILIHAGAGGVGMAAIQVARAAGAVVYATAGSEEKRAFLRSMGVPHVMDSRTLDFADEIRELTAGRGVDIVLNSLVGPFVDAGIGVLAPGGRFLEMGVADLRDAAAVARLRSDISYLPFNLASALEAGEPFVRETISAVLERFAGGAFQPLPREVFPMDRAQDGFRFMAQARHIGRVVLCPAGDPAAGGIRRDGAYLVTGGMSGVGLAVAEWLGRRGAAQVLVMGRREPDAQATGTFAAMREAGTEVTVCRGDVANAADVERALRKAKEFPLRGVFHCAGVLDDGVLLHQDWSRFERVLSPKVRGAWNLHRLTANLPLDHFVLFSSVASVFGSPGQANYAAANAFLDAMAQYRSTRGMAGLSINWGAWSETGMALRHGALERAAKSGVQSMTTAEGLRSLEMLLAEKKAQVIASSIDWDRYLQAAEAVPPLLRELRARRGADSFQSPSREKPRAFWLPQLESAAPAQRHDLLLRLIEERVRATLGLGTEQAIDPAQPLQELGLDSLLSIELRNSLGACLERTLPATLLFNYPTLAGLAAFLLGELNLAGAEGRNRHAMDDTMRAAPVALLEDIEAMSDEEVARLLNARAMGGVR